MTIFQIQCFLNVAEYLNFTEAANHLFVAQSSLSRNVSNLEEELGMKLFVRTKKYVRLTSSGAILYEEFSKLMKLGEAAVQKARNAELGENGSIVLGVIETQRSENFLPHALHLLRENHPNIRIDIISGNFHELRESMLNGRIDIALTLEIVSASISNSAQMRLSRFLVIFFLRRKARCFRSMSVACNMKKDKGRLVA